MWIVETQRVEFAAQGQRSGLDRLVGVAVAGFSLVALFAEALRHVFRHHHGTMVPPGAAEGNREVAFPLVDVVGNEIDQKFLNAIQKLDGLREAAHVAGDLGVEPSEVAVFRDVVRIGQKADIEDQVAGFGHAVAEAETGDGNAEGRLVLMIAEAGLDVIPEFMDVELGGIDDGVGEFANALQVDALGIDAVLELIELAQRVGRRVSL